MFSNIFKKRRNVIVSIFALIAFNHSQCQNSNHNTKSVQTSTIKKNTSMKLNELSKEKYTQLPMEATMEDQPS